MTNENKNRYRTRSVKSASDIDDVLTRPSQKDLFEFWNETRQQDLIPLATEIDPTRIPHLLKDVAIFDIFDKTDVRYRLAGTSIAERMGVDPTGKNLIDMLSSDNRELVSELFEAVIQQPAAILVEYENVYKGGKRAVVHSLYLPLGKTESTSPRIISTHEQHETLAYEDSQSSTAIAAAITKVVWIDVGAGVPALAQAEG